MKKGCFTGLLFGNLPLGTFVILAQTRCVGISVGNAKVTIMTRVNVYNLELLLSGKTPKSINTMPDAL